MAPYPIYIHWNGYILFLYQYFRNDDSCFQHVLDDDDDDVDVHYDYVYASNFYQFHFYDEYFCNFFFFYNYSLVHLLSCKIVYNMCAIGMRDRQTINKDFKLSGCLL